MSGRLIKMCLIAAAAVSLAWLPSQTKADWLRGHQLKAQCELDAARPDWSFCDGYVAGVAESLKLGGAVCQPDDIEPVKLSKIVVAYLGKHEDALSQVAFALSGRALKEAYPCPDKAR